MTTQPIPKFNFYKKPMNPSFLLYMAKLFISWPDLKKRKCKVEKIKMEELENGPYILLVNHSSMVDFNIMLKATHPTRVNNVMTLEGFQTYTEPLMRSLGVVGKRKYVDDINLIRNIKYSLFQLKNTFVLFPEARYSLDGCTSYIPPSLGKLIKLMKVPVVMLKIHGNFITCPQWNKINKKTYVEAKMYPLLSTHDISHKSLDEINQLIKEHFAYDDFTWQLENHIEINHPKRAEGLHALLYQCPHCKMEFRMDSKGTSIWCNSCHKKWEMNTYGELKADQGMTEFSHIPDWSKWERDNVRQEVRKGTYYFEDEIHLETLPNAKRFYKHGKAKLTHSREGFKIEGVLYGKEQMIMRTPLQLESLHIEYDYLGRGDCIDISTIEDSYWCYVTKKDVITKLSFATEELHFYAKELGRNP